MKVTSSHEAWRNFFPDCDFFSSSKQDTPEPVTNLCPEGFWSGVTAKCVHLLSPSNESTQTRTQWHTQTHAHIWPWLPTEVGKQTMTKPDRGASSWEQVLNHAALRSHRGRRALDACSHASDEEGIENEEDAHLRMWKRQSFSTLSVHLRAKSAPEAVILKWWCNVDLGKERRPRDQKLMKKKDPAASRGASLTHIWRRLWVVSPCSVNGGWQSPPKWARNHIWRHSSGRSDVADFFCNSQRVYLTKREKLTQEVFESSVLVELLALCFQHNIYVSGIYSNWKRIEPSEFIQSAQNQCVIKL